MRSGRQLLAIAIVLAGSLACGGCGYFSPYRQGFISTYRPELRKLAEDINHAELAKIANPREAASGTEECGEEPPPLPTAWQPPSLLSAVRLQPPVGPDGSPPDPP
jgi:hypothetical protein